MKNFIACFAFLCLCSIGFSQNYNSVLVENWSEDTGDWVNYSESFRTYEAGELVLNETKLFNVETGEWDISSRTTYDYDPDGEYSVTLSEHWTGSEWEETGKRVDSLNAAGKTTDYTRFIKEDNEWVFNFHQVNTYESDTLLVEALQQYSNDTTFSEKWESFYNEDGLLDSNSVYLLNWGEWYLNMGYHFEYTSFNKVNKRFSWLWEPDLAVWYLGSAVDYYYDADQLLSEYDYSFYSIENELLGGYRSLYTHNPDGTTAQIVDQDLLDGDWVNSGRWTYNYGDVNGISDIEPVSFYVYPNPAQTFIQFSSNQTPAAGLYRVINTVGKSVKTGNFNSINRQINVSTLPAGFYLLEIQTNGKMGVSKFVKR